MIRAIAAAAKAGHPAFLEFLVDTGEGFIYVVSPRLCFTPSLSSVAWSDVACLGSLLLFLLFAAAPVVHFHAPPNSIKATSSPSFLPGVGNILTPPRPVFKRGKLAMHRALRSAV